MPGLGQSVLHTDKVHNAHTVSYSNPTETQSKETWCAHLLVIELYALPLFQQRSPPLYSGSDGHVKNRDFFPFFSSKFINCKQWQVASANMKFFMLLINEFDYAMELSIPRKSVFAVSTEISALVVFIFSALVVFIFQLNVLLHFCKSHASLSIQSRSRPLFLFYSCFGSSPAFCSSQHCMECLSYICVPHLYPTLEVWGDSEEMRIGVEMEHGTGFFPDLSLNLLCRVS